MTSLLELCCLLILVYIMLFVSSLTIVVLILESQLADSFSGSQRMKNKTFPTENNSTCWLHQPYKIISECHPCSGKKTYIVNYLKPLILVNCDLSKE